MDIIDIVVLALIIAIALTILEVTLPVIIILVILYLAIYYLRHEFFSPEEFCQTNVLIRGTGGLGGFPYYYPTLNFPYNYPYYLYPWNYNYYYYPSGAYNIYTDQYNPYGNPPILGAESIQSIGPNEEITDVTYY